MVPSGSIAWPGWALKCGSWSGMGRKPTPTCSNQPAQYLEVCYCPLQMETSTCSSHAADPPDRGYSGHCCWTQLTTSELAQRKEPHCTGMCSYRKSWHLAAWNILHLVNLYFNFCRVLKPSVFPQGPWWNEHHHMPRSVEQGSTCNRSSNQATGTTQPAQAKELMPG